MPLGLHYRSMHGLTYRPSFRLNLLGRKIYFPGMYV
ncbi:Ras-related protein RABE1c, partial [Zea mays]